MRAILVVFLAFAGCVYIDREEYLDAWDKDGDAWGLDDGEGGADFDCDDENPDVHPYAADIRGDGCDSDCGTEPDFDGDDWPDDSDCVHDDPAVHPCAEDLPGDGVDSDCDGRDEPRTDTCPTRDPDWPEVESVTCGDPG